MPRKSSQRKPPLGGIPGCSVPPKVIVCTQDKPDTSGFAMWRTQMSLCCRRRSALTLGSAGQWSSCQERLRVTEASLKAAEASITVWMALAVSLLLFDVV